MTTSLVHKATTVSQPCPCPCPRRNVVTTCLEKILIQRNVSDAVAYVKSVISDLLMNKIDLSLLVVSKVGSLQQPAPVACT